MPITVKKSATPVQLIAPVPEVKVLAKQPVGKSSKMHKDGSQETVETPVGGPLLVPEPHATVGVSVGVTRNLGNYESVKFTVSLHLPSKPDPVSIAYAYIVAKAWVDTRTEELNQEITDQLG